MYAHSLTIFCFRLDMFSKIVDFADFYNYLFLTNLSALENHLVTFNRTFYYVTYIAIVLVLLPIYQTLRINLHNFFHTANFYF